MRLKDKLRSIDTEKQQKKLYLSGGLPAGERLRDDRDSARPATLRKAQEVESLSREVARPIRQSFAKGNEIADLKEQCDGHRAEIERLNDVIALSQHPFFLTRSEAP